jgi:hypothetical protein
MNLRAPGTLRRCSLDFERGNSVRFALPRVHVLHRDVIVVVGEAVSFPYSYFPRRYSSFTIVEMAQESDTFPWNW